MFPSNIELLKHVIDEVSFVLDATTGKTKDDVTSDPVLSRAIIRSLEIIGEASNKVDPDFTVLYPHVEWRKMAATRNRLIHDYFGIDYDIVWDIIVSKLPSLKNDLNEIIDDH